MDKIDRTWVNVEVNVHVPMIQLTDTNTDIVVIGSGCMHEKGWFVVPKSSSDFNLGWKVRVEKHNHHLQWLSKSCRKELQGKSRSITQRQTEQEQWNIMICRM